MTVAPYPNSHSLKRCWPWQSATSSAASTVPDLARIAHHEGGHIVMFEWLGLTTGLSATATPASGLTYHGVPPGVYPAGPPDETGELAAMAASAYHGGLIAELILAGIDWRCPIHYPHESDYQRANDMLRESFGTHSSAGHAFAQRVALHVLGSQWARVQEIADVLMRHGVWP